MIEVLLILVALSLVAACGAFVAAEFSLITVDRNAIDRLADEGDRRATGVSRALRTLSTQLSGAQLGITVTNLAIGFLAEPSIARLVDGPLESLGLSDTAAKGVAVIIALVLATAVTMVFGELVPKNLAISKPVATARAVAGFQRGFTHATAWPLKVLNGSANGLLRRMGIEPQEELASARSAQELSSLVQRSAEQGTLETNTATLLQRSIAFAERRADDVMTPRTRMKAIDEDETVEAVLELARQTGHSRFPVEVEDSEEIAGIVHIRHAVKVPFERRGEVLVRDVMVEPVVVPSSLELDPLLAVLRQGGLQIAVVVDEFGGVDGIVTLEDLIEEIVGEVLDEHDDRTSVARRQADGSWLMPALLRPDEAEDIIGAPVPEDEDYETLGGLVALHLERIPDVGDAVVIDGPDEDDPHHRVTFTVNTMDGLRVDELRVVVEHLERPDDEDEDRR
ncbi:hemolysin family protein [Patulibacter minatonensis]|uniref:hemolysin family protein n=1 Tax=Patulibacter minatonensis TaxID=298163 RepID=UPI00047DD7CF|nr:hemolysin family protein [Patulibacter minatonensis]